MGESAAPLCATVAGDASGKEVFSVPVVPTGKILEALVFGGMDPGTLEPINYELGFRLNDINVPVTSPGALYLQSIESTRYIGGFRDGETDFGMTFHVCSKEGDSANLVAVEGDFAHMTELAPALLAYLDSDDVHCDMSDGPEEDTENCAVRFNDLDNPVIVAAGDPLGSAGGTGLTAYMPGFDFNLLDARFAVPWINPDRIGAEEGPGRGFRYGACVYEYFSEPMMSEYLGLVGQNGVMRDDPQIPCGTMAIDVENSAAGLWMRADQTQLDISTDWVGVLSNVLVVGPHPITPQTHQVISSELLEVAEFNGGGILLEYEYPGAGEVNPRIQDIEPGTIYCLESEGYLNPTPFYHYIMLSEDRTTLRIERLENSCAAVATMDRGFSNAAIDFVR